SRGAREPFRDPLRHWPVTLLLLFCFLPFFLRWEPPGSEPASLALAALGDPPAASLRSGAAPAPGGIAAAVALLSLGGWVPVERSTHFLLSLGMALLCFLMAGAASQWFARSAALVGTLMLLALYAFPQSLLGWGALSTVYGVMFGFLFLEACRVLRIRPLNPREVGALALGLSFTWQCAPTAA